MGEKITRSNNVLAMLGAAILVVQVAVGITGTVQVQPSGNQRQPEATPKWEVVSIKVCGDVPGTRGGGLPRFSPDRMVQNCQSVESLIGIAYGWFRDGQSVTVRELPTIQGGPSWIRSDRYMIEAKAEGTPAAAMMSGPMLQSLLKDRFKLEMHREVREVPIYELTVTSKDKLQTFTEGSCVPFDMRNALLYTITGKNLPPVAPGEKRCVRLATSAGPAVTLDADGIGLDEFVDMLHPDGRRVINKTGITGLFNFHMAFAHDDGRPTADAVYPSVFTAIQQFGLKLEAGKGPYAEVLIIDRIERPSAN